MGLFDKFPYTNYHQLNLDWIIKKIKTVDERMDSIDASADAAEAAKTEAQTAANTASSAASEAVLAMQRIVGGSPIPVTLASEMTDNTLVYLYMGSEEGYTNGNWYYYDGSAWVSGGEYGYADPSTLSAITDAIGSTTETVNNIGSYLTGNYWNSTGTTASLTEYASYTAFNPIRVTPGDTYEAYVRSGASSRQDPLLFTDSSYNIIYGSGHPATVEWTTYTGTVPAGAYYALITANTINADTLSSHYFNVTHTELNSVVEIKEKTDLALSGFMDLTNKTVAILGDSISTNGDYSDTNLYGNVPEIVIHNDDIGVTLSAYVTYYDVGTVIGGYTITSADIGTELSFTPTADDVGKMIGVPLNYNSSTLIPWWMRVKNVMDFNPVPVCWSGSSISSHEGNKEIYKTSYAWHDAQIRKCGVRTPGSMDRTAPDLVIIYRGVNDFSHTPYTRLDPDYFDDDSWSYPVSDYDQYYQFKSGLVLTIKKLRSVYPQAKIILCTLNVFKRVYYSEFPTNNGINTLPQYNNAIREVADYMGCGLIEFDKDGITFENCYSEGYITDSSTNSTHPNNKGHAVMANRALRDLMQNNSL